MEATSLFYNRFDRLRSGWRFAIFAALFAFILGILLTIIIGLFFGVPSDDSTKNVALRLATSLAILVSALFSGWICGKYLEDLPFRALGASFSAGWLRNLVAGVAVGAVTLIIAVVVAITFGGLSFQIDRDFGTSAIVNSLGVSAMIFVAGAAWEEALFRGYILQTVSRSGFAWLAIVITAAFFGFVHFRNPDAGIISTLNTALAGVWFGLAYLKTRDLWFPSGMHLMWNWMQGAFFGIEVSGLTDITTAPLLKEIDRGPAWLTGETYGIEGGIACTVAIIISIIAIHYLPFLKADEEMLELTSSETPRVEIKLV
jgi:membrane protease YdiL (CAAX protease family)